MHEDTEKTSAVTVLHVVGGLNRIGGIMHVARELACGDMPGFRNLLWKCRGYEGAKVEAFAVPLGVAKQTDVELKSDLIGALRDTIPLLRWVRKQRRVILHAHTRFGIIASSIVAGATGCPLVIHFHGLQSRPGGYKKLLKLTGATPVFNSVRTCRHFGFDTGHSCVITPTLNWPTTAAATGGKRRFVATGAFAPVKKLEVIIDAFECLLASGTDAELSLIGYTPSPFAADYQSAIVARAKGNKAIQIVAQDPNWTARLMENDVFVHAADRESFGIVILQAFAKGCRLVVPTETFLDELPEPLRSRSIYRCEDTTVSTLCNQMKAAVERDVSASELWGLRHQAANEFSIERARLKLSTVYESVLH